MDNPLLRVYPGKKQFIVKAVLHCMLRAK